MKNEGLMDWFSLERVWKASGRKTHVRVRFNDWTQQIKYFTIHGETPCGKKLFGKLDTGEEMTFSKKSRGWSLYHAECEYQAHAV